MGPCDFYLPMVGVYLPLLPAQCQHGGTGEVPWGPRVCDSSAEPISTAATVSLYRFGIPSGQGATSAGRALFRLYTIGDLSGSWMRQGYPARATRPVYAGRFESRIPWSPTQFRLRASRVLEFSGPWTSSIFSRPYSIPRQQGVDRMSKVPVEE
jgi:hypothetical protein